MKIAAAEASKKINTKQQKLIYTVPKHRNRVAKIDLHYTPVKIEVHRGWEREEGDRFWDNNVREIRECETHVQTIKDNSFLGWTTI